MLPFIVGVSVLIVVFFLAGYLKAPPDTAYIISGLGKRKILIGRHPLLVQNVSNGSAKVALPILASLRIRKRKETVMLAEE